MDSAQSSAVRTDLQEHVVERRVFPSADAAFARPVPRVPAVEVESKFCPREMVSF